MTGRNVFFGCVRIPEPQDMLNWTVVRRNRIAWTKLTETHERTKAQACCFPSSRFPEEAL